MASGGNGCHPPKLSLMLPNLAGGKAGLCKNMQCGHPLSTLEMATRSCRGYFRSRVGNVRLARLAGIEIDLGWWTRIVKLPMDHRDNNVQLCETTHSSIP